jgi:hypothetical protein
MTVLRTAPSAARTARTPPSTAVAALLAWLVPGLGHWYLGHRDRAIILFVTIVVLFWGGVALGGVRSTFNVQENGPWLAAQICTGPQAIVGLMWAKSLKGPQPGLGIVDRNEASYPSADIAVVYSGVAGLLNLLVIIDVLARSEARAIPIGARSPPAGGRT